MRIEYLEKYLNVAEMARLTGFSRQGIYDFIKRGELSCYRIGKYLYLDRADVDRMVEKKRSMRDG
jgi:excisionase family DNA binding protein